MLLTTDVYTPHAPERLCRPLGIREVNMTDAPTELNDELDRDAVLCLELVREQLQEELGFQTTPSQTVHYLVRSLLKNPR
jgi:hypothetical protein